VLADVNCTHRFNHCSLFSLQAMKDIRIYVQTADGCCTIWYERSKEKCSAIQERVYNQLCGLNIKKIEVSVIGA